MPRRKSGREDHYRRLGTALTNPLHPIVGVSWFNANQYAAWATLKAGLNGAARNRFRLPSEAEWEYAARAEYASPQRSTVWGHGDDEARLGQFAWFSGNSGAATSPVRGKAANGFGLYDMAGNAWEWTQDCYVSNYFDAPSDGQAVGRFDDRDCVRVLRGGSWNNSPDVLRSAVRYFYLSDNHSNNIGFRLARTLLTR